MRYYLKYKNAVNFVTIPLVLIGLSTVLPTHHSGTHINTSNVYGSAYQHNIAFFNIGL